MAVDVIMVWSHLPEEVQCVIELSSIVLNAIRDDAHFFAIPVIYYRSTNLSLSARFDLSQSVFTENVNIQNHTQNSRRTRLMAHGLP